MLKLSDRATGHLMDWEIKLYCDEANEAGRLLSR